MGHECKCGGKCKNKQSAASDEMAQAYADTIQTLMRQAMRWTIAAEQDENPLIRLTHANYGVAYITMLRQIAPNGLVKQVTGQDAHQVSEHIARVQDWALRSFAPYVPQMIPAGPLGKMIQ